MDVQGAAAQLVAQRIKIVEQLKRYDKGWFKGIGRLDGLSHSLRFQPVEALGTHSNQVLSATVGRGVDGAAKRLYTPFINPVWRHWYGPRVEGVKEQMRRLDPVIDALRDHREASSVADVRAAYEQLAATTDPAAFVQGAEAFSEQLKAAAQSAAKAAGEKAGSLAGDAGTDDLLDALSHAVVADQMVDLRHAAKALVKEREPSLVTWRERAVLKAEEVARRPDVDEAVREAALQAPAGVRARYAQLQELF